MRFTTSCSRLALICAASALLATGAQPAGGLAQPAGGASPPSTTAPARPAPETAQLRAFPSPEEAVKALIEALQAPKMQSLIPILGRAVLNSVPQTEQQADQVRRAAGAWLARQPYEIAYPDEPEHRRALALIGEARVPLPAVLVRTQRGWVFDSQGTIEAMRERRIGVNEANALRALRALAAAQAKFRVSDRFNDGVLQYSRHIRAATPGQIDGLVTDESVPGASLDLLNHAFAEAEGEPGDPKLRPPAGYGYRILSGQGPHAEGGARSYLVDGRMTEGFAAVAWPTRPGETGLSTFIMDHRGMIFEREFGDRTVDEVRRMTAFDPGPGWDRVEEPE
ncbi:MAG TPA: DUF2950 family protein [Roseomonas sp.]|nr:DUF2950 family protein [Roseomonas sp.]